jgi:hypothetical protein
MTRTFHLQSSVADCIAWEEMTASEARALFAMEDMADDRARPGAEVAALYWPNTEVLLEQDMLAVDDVQQARARYCDVFARTWDDERAGHGVG